MEFEFDKPTVLNASDEATFTDRDGVPHSVFQQNRRALILTVPLHRDVRDPSFAEDLAEVVIEAMERDRRG
jgi:hypothetical protein